MATLRAQFDADVDFLETIGALQRGAPLVSITCPACSEDHAVDVEYDRLTKTSRIFCPEAGSVTVRDEELMSVHADPMWLANWLVKAFQVLPPIRIRAILPGCVWHLGEAIFGNTSLMLILTAGIQEPEMFDRLVAMLREHPPSQIGIVLISGPLPSQALLARHRYYPLDLRELVRAASDGLSIESKRLSARVKQFLRNASHPIGSNAGRRSFCVEILEDYTARRERGVDYLNCSAEAKAILEEWPSRHLKISPPDESTVRKHLRARRR